MLPHSYTTRKIECAAPTKPRTAFEDVAALAEVKSAYLLADKRYDIDAILAKLKAAPLPDATTSSPDRSSTAAIRNAYEQQFLNRTQVNPLGSRFERDEQLSAKR